MNTSAVSNNTQTVEMDVRLPVKQGVNDLPHDIPAVAAALQRARAYATELVAVRVVLDATKTPTSAADKTRNTKAKKVVDRNIALLEDLQASLLAEYVQSDAPPSRPPSPFANVADVVANDQRSASTPIVQAEGSAANVTSTNNISQEGSLLKRVAEPLVEEEPAAKKMRPDADTMIGIVGQQASTTLESTTTPPSTPPGLTRPDVPPSRSTSLSVSDDIPTGYDTPKAMTPAGSIPSGYDTPNIPSSTATIVPPSTSADNSNVSSASNGTSPTRSVSVPVTPEDIPAGHDTLHAPGDHSSDSTSFSAPTSDVAAATPQSSSGNGSSAAPFRIMDTPPTTTPQPPSTAGNGSSAAPFRIQDTPPSTTPPVAPTNSKRLPQPRPVKKKTKQSLTEAKDDEVEIVEVRLSQPQPQATPTTARQEAPKRQVHDVENNVDVLEDVPPPKPKKSGNGKGKGKGKAASGTTKKYVHAADTWNLLTRVQQSKNIRRKELDKVRFEKYNLPPSDATRCWTLREASFNAETAISSEMYATACFINKQGRTVCHLHATTKLKAHDKDVDPDSPFSITGVPFASSQPEKKRTIKYLEPKIPKQARMGHQRQMRDPLARNDRFTLARVLKFFPRDPTNSFYIMHCGCVLEHALLDFYKFKSLAIVSASTHKSEPYARMAKPRERLADYTLFTRFGLSVADLFMHDIDGSTITEVDRLQRLIGRLDHMVDKQYAEEYAAIKRDIKRQADAAKQKFQSRPSAYVELSSGSEAGSSIFHDSDEDNAGPSSIRRRPVKPTPRRPNPDEESSEDESEDDRDANSDEDAEGITDDEGEEAAESGGQ